MGIGDRKPDNVGYTGATSNGCKWGTDGNLYNQYGYRIESLAEKRARKREEEAARDAQFAARRAYTPNALDALANELEERAYNAVAGGCKKVLTGTLKGAVMAGTGIYHLAKKHKEKKS